MKSNGKETLRYGLCLPNNKTPQTCDYAEAAHLLDVEFFGRRFIILPPSHLSMNSLVSKLLTKMTGIWEHGQPMTSHSKYSFETQILTKRKVIDLDSVGGRRRDPEFLPWCQHSSNYHWGCHSLSSVSSVLYILMKYI